MSDGISTTSKKNPFVTVFAVVPPLRVTICALEGALEGATFPEMTCCARAEPWGRNGTKKLRYRWTNKKAMAFASFFYTPLQGADKHSFTQVFDGTIPSHLDLEGDDGQETWSFFFMQSNFCFGVADGILA